MKRIFLLIPVAAAVALAFVGCQNRTPSSSAAKLYPLKGKVVDVDVVEKTVTIDHEDIPGLMTAMQMKFSVEDAKLLDGIKPGSQVEGKLNNASGKYVLTALKERSGAPVEDKKIQKALAKLSPEDRSLAEAQRRCPSSGEPLGSMGTPVMLTLNGQTVFICCLACKDETEKDPNSALQKVATYKAEK